MKSEEIILLGNNQLILEDNLHSYMYKALKWSEKLRKNVNRPFLKKHMTNKELVYHPLWIAKTLVLAGRHPFPPKKIPKMVFVDALSGYRGMLSTVPETSTLKVTSNQLIEADIFEEEAKKYIIDVQEKQINRSYVLKKPDHQLVDISLHYLPLWKTTVKSTIFNKDFIINANTGESEEHMGKFWADRNRMKIS